MQLKTLKIKGFKSFADPTTIEFNEGVTAVVGPNGSGKSNVIEAIRWVMGEQSAKSLRGGRMNDVIFSGTSSRKPMNIAEVTLTLDNSTGFLPIDFDEVSITRRLNRSGESDYMINKQSCRLKDIVELFMDSGLGKESFSIISQGQVEAIFNSKPEDRRAIFEEAAGVFKYKTQKYQAERKLEDTQGNLDRVQDILYELEGQVGPLKDQAEKAKRYLELKDDLRDTDIGLSVMKIKKYSDEMNQAQASFQENDGEISELNHQLDQETANQAELDQEITQLTNQREDLQTKNLDLVQAIERAESALAIRDEKAKHKEEFLSSKRQQIADQESRLKSLQEKIHEKESLRNELNEAIKTLNQELKDKRERLGYLQDGASERIEDLRADYIDLMQEKANVNNEDQSLNQEIQKSTLQASRLKQNQQEAEEALSQDQEALKEKEEALNQVSQDLNDLLNEFQEIDTKQKSLNQSIKADQDQLQKLKNDYERAQAKHQSLSQMQDNYAGYFAGVKEIMQNQDRLQGIVGTVADLISIPSQYLEAIDTVLGSSSQFVVVRDEQSGRQAIQYLKQKRSGRATFLPMTTIKARYVRQDNLNRAQQEPGYIGIASDLIDYNPEVDAIIKNLLGNILVAEDLDAANKIARAIGYSSRVVSLDGNVMNAGGSMTGGGSRSNNSHIFTQKEELKSLGQTLENLKPRIQELSDHLEDQTQKRQDLVEHLEEIRQIGENKRYQENNLKNEVNNLKESTKQGTQRVKAGNYELKELSDNLNQAKNRLEELQVEKERVYSRIDQINAELEDLNEAKEDSSQKQNEMLKAIESLTDQLSTKRESLASAKAGLESLQSQQADASSQIDRLNKDIETYQSTDQLASKEELEDQVQTLTSDQETLQEKDQSLKAELKTLTEDLDHLEGQIKAHQDRLQSLNQAQNKLEVAKSRLEVNLDYQLNYLVEEYSISYEEAEKLPPLDQDFDQAAQDVKTLKKAIKNLGPVNLTAVEEYDQVSERYEFLSKQQNDLLEAKDQLHQTMDEMDEAVKSRFKESFDQIKDQFAKVFPQMFGGGRAELQLTDPDDLLHTGVEIVAQPPGKKLSTLTLLSGGERALTAISLLFAIIQVSPIPFCILDEAEAALDESNVMRFGHYLQNFETDTQFIVITHRKGTMEQADSLYGITMQEKGVSKLVSVRFDDVEEMDLET